MQARLIMLKGVPFTGKSTTSEFVAQQLGLNGYQVRWLSEGMMLQGYFTHMRRRTWNRSASSSSFI